MAHNNIVRKSLLIAGTSMTAWLVITGILLYGAMHSSSPLVAFIPLAILLLAFASIFASGSYAGTREVSKGWQFLNALLFFVIWIGAVALGTATLRLMIVLLRKTPSPRAAMLLLFPWFALTFFAVLILATRRSLKRATFIQFGITSPVAPFAPSDGAARWTKGLMLAILVLSVVGIISGLLQIDLLSRAGTAGISDAEAAANDSRQQLIGVLQILAHLGTGVAFLTWFHRIVENLPSLGGRALKYTPGWAVAGFFVPFLNLVRPLQVMREVWHGSDPSGLERDTAPSGPSIRNQLGTPPLVGWWWALFLITGILQSIIERMVSAPNQSLDDLQELSLLFVFTNLLEITSVLVAIRLVGRITSWQTERAELVRQRRTQSPMAPARGAPSGRLW